MKRIFTNVASRVNGATLATEFKTAPVRNYQPAAFRLESAQFKDFALSIRMVEERVPEVQNRHRVEDYLSSSGSTMVAMHGLAPYTPTDRVYDSISNELQKGPRDVPFFILDQNRIVQKLDQWNMCFPNVNPHYAVKCNPNPDIIKLMAQDLQMSFDCASPAEIDLVMSFGVEPHRIIYANPCKPIGHIEFARERGVKRMTFDSASELYKVKAVYPDADLVLRIWTDDSGAQCSLSVKYGATVQEAKDLLPLAKSLDLNLVGVSFHAGSGGGLNTYVTALRDAGIIFQAAKQIGFNMTLLDIGGGFPGTDTEALSLRTISEVIQPIISSPEWDNVEIISEPGRFFAAESQTLTVRVIGKRQRAGLTNYTLNDGLYGSFNCLLYDHSHLLDEDVSVDGGKPSVLFGQTCDGFDMISKGLMLPDLMVGDYLTFPVMGAYTSAAGSNFNGFKLPEHVVLASNVVSKNIESRYS